MRRLSAPSVVEDKSWIPVRADGSKAPLMSGWRDYAERHPTDEELVFTEDVAAILAGTYTDHMQFEYSFARTDFVRK